MKNNTEKLKEAAEQFCIAYTAEKERVFQAIIPNYTKDDGGAAFPSDNFGKTEQQGMTLRDYFAAAALQGICSNIHCTPSVTYKEVAIHAYEQADAMLQARKEGV